MNTDENSSLNELDDDLDVSLDHTNKIIESYDEDESDDRADDILKDIEEQEKKRTDSKSLPFYKKPIGLAVISFAVLIVSFVIYKSMTGESARRNKPAIMTNNSPTNNPVVEKIESQEQQSALRRGKIQAKKQSNTPPKPATAKQKVQLLKSTDTRSSNDVNSALSFEPKNNRDVESASTNREEKDKDTFKLKTVNKALNEELRSLRETVKAEKAKNRNLASQLEAVKDQKKDLELNIELSGRNRIGGMKIQEFAMKGTVAVVTVSGRSPKDSIIALKKGELLRVGHDFLTVNEVNFEKSHLLVGAKYYIDSTLVPYKKNVTTKVKNKAKKKVSVSKNVKTETVSGQRLITDWNIVLVSTEKSQDKSFVVVKSDTGEAVNLRIGSKLYKYGTVKNILRDGTVVFKNHILHYIAKP